MMPFKNDSFLILFPYFTLPQSCGRAFLMLRKRRNEDLDVKIAEKEKRVYDNKAIG